MSFPRLMRDMPKLPRPRHTAIDIGLVSTVIAIGVFSRHYATKPISQATVYKLIEDSNPFHPCSN